MSHQMESKQAASHTVIDEAAQSYAVDPATPVINPTLEPAGTIKGGYRSAEGSLDSNAVIASIEARVLKGASARAAAIAAGIPEQTWYSWQHTAKTGLWPNGAAVDPTLLAFTRALRERIARAEAEVEARCQETLFDAGNQAVGTKDWRARESLLKHQDATRARWHEYREVHIEQSGTVSLEHRLAVKMDRDQLTECIDDPEWRELLEEGQSGR